MFIRSFSNKVVVVTWGLDIAKTLSDAGGVGALLQIADHTSGKTFFPTYDGNGNVVALLNASNGAVAAVYEYSPYGEFLRCETTDPVVADQPFRFSTKFFDAETGLYDYGRRYYDPRTGRWLSRDPKEELGGFHLYGFVGNNPMNRWDYLGMDWSGFLGCGWAEAYAAWGSDFSSTINESAVVFAQMASDSASRKANEFLSGAVPFEMPSQAQGIGSSVQNFAALSFTNPGFISDPLNNPQTGTNVFIPGYGTLTIINYSNQDVTTPVRGSPNGVVSSTLLMTFVPVNGQAANSFSWQQTITNDPANKQHSYYYGGGSVPYVDDPKHAGSFEDNFPQGIYSDNVTPIYSTNGINFYDNPGNRPQYPLDLSTNLVDKKTGLILQQINWQVIPRSGDPGG